MTPQKYYDLAKEMDDLADQSEAAGSTESAIEAKTWAGIYRSRALEIESPPAC